MKIVKILISFLISFFPAFALVQAGEQSAYALDPADCLWQIGTPDNDTSEFALGPKGYREYAEDGLFIVGQSDPNKDWPYVQPGPDDAWAGGTRHTFTIIFVTKQTTPYGKCRLIFDLVDTHSKKPPNLSRHLELG